LVAAAGAREQLEARDAADQHEHPGVEARTGEPHAADRDDAVVVVFDITPS